MSASDYDNAIDVLVEVALFDADKEYVAVRANDAGSKVIYTDDAGRDRTYWARDWTISSVRLTNAADELRARSSQ
ncbi:MAG TPA: hypothetical protein VF463_19925 [Sphingobium sp.]